MSCPLVPDVFVSGCTGLGSKPLVVRRKITAKTFMARWKEAAHTMELLGEIRGGDCVVHVITEIDLDRGTLKMVGSLVVRS